MVGVEVLTFDSNHPSSSTDPTCGTRLQIDIGDIFHTEDISASGGPGANLKRTRPHVTPDGQIGLVDSAGGKGAACTQIASWMPTLVSNVSRDGGDVD